MGAAAEETKGNPQPIRRPRHGNHQEEVSFVLDQARMPRCEAMRQKEAQMKGLQVTMHETYDSKEDYITKLKELIDTEAEIDRLNTEVIAE